MAILTIYVSDRTLAVLQRIARERDTNVAQLAENAVEDEAFRAETDEDRAAQRDAERAQHD